MTKIAENNRNMTKCGEVRHSAYWYAKKYGIYHCDKTTYTGRYLDFIPVYHAFGDAIERRKIRRRSTTAPMPTPTDVRRAGDTIRPIFEEDGKRKWGHRPLLAETFCDIGRTAGTCYRAAGWEEVGKTKGFPRVKDGKGSGVSPLGPSGWQGTISSADSGAEVDGKESPI